MNVPGQPRGNITLCAAISLQGVLNHYATLGPYSTAHIITFMDVLHDAVVQEGLEQPRFVVIWDNVCFQGSALVQDFAVCILAPSYSLPVSQSEESFAICCLKVYDCQPHACLPARQ